MLCSFLSSNQISNSNLNDFDLNKKRKIPTFQSLGVGKKGKGDNSFNSPFSCALSSDHLFVADYGNHRIQVFSKDTLTFIKTIGGSNSTIRTESNLNHPISICYNERLDYIYVADFYHHRIQVYNVESGDWICSIGDNDGKSGNCNNSFHSPQGVCIDYILERLYIADTGNNRVQVYHSNSFEYLFSIGEYGSSNSSFDSPGAVCIDHVSQNLYVSDWNNERVQIFSAHSGKWKRTIGITGEEGISNNHLSGPYGVSIDFVSNLVYVVDSSNNRVQVFNKDDGVFVRSIFIKDNEVVKSENGNINNSLGLYQSREVCVDQKTGKVYIVDRGNHRILIDLTYQRNSFIKKSTNVFSQPLLNAMEKIVNTNQCADIILLVEGERLPAHKIFLYARSRYFQQLIDEKNKSIAPFSDSIPELQIFGTTPIVMREFLQYLYTDQCSSIESFKLHVIPLLALAIKYEINPLIIECEKKILQTLSSTTACEILYFAEKNNRIELMESIILFIIKNPKMVLLSESFQALLRMNPDLILQVTHRIASTLD